MMLNNKNAVIYGAGGAVGGAVALALAHEGARVFLAGRTPETLETVAKKIIAAGGKAVTAKVDALSKQSVETQLEEIIKTAGNIDISLNAIGIGDIHGFPLTEMQAEQFVLPVMNAMTTQFITAAAAARYMAKQGAGVILAVTANAAQKPFENVGGFGVACAAMEAFCRQLAVEEGKHGVRVVCIRSAGSPDAPGVDEVFNLHAANAGITREAFETVFAERTMLKRLPKLAEVANAVVLMASGNASAITAAVINVTCGEIAD